MGLSQVVESARNLDRSWTAVDGIMKHAVAQGLARRTVVAPKLLSIDETSFQRQLEPACT